MEESKLIFSLDHHDEGPTVAFSKDKPQAKESRTDLSLGIDLDLSQGHRSQPPFLAHSPSSPGSLADLSASSAGLLVTTNLVKSSSTDLEPRESSSLRGKPLLSLVKSLSTEISRRFEPEVNLSKSDSKLHLHPWKQLTQPKIAETRPDAGGVNESDDWASPPSAGSMSPTEPRGNSLIAELEDTRRKFSVAMQDPLSMLSKIMGDESCGSPKQGRASGAGDSPASQGSCGREGSSEDSDFKCRRRTDSEHRGVCDTPLRRLQKGPLIKSSVSPERHSLSRDSHFEIRTYGDMIQVVELQNESRGTHHKTYSQSRGIVPGPSLPIYWLLPVGLLAYGFFVLPLPSYLTGLSVGVACGFLLGLVVVFMFAPRRSNTRGKRGSRFKSNLSPLDGEITDPEILEGWMNETHSYDPETFHPSLTHSVYVTLEGSRLHLAHPRANIPRWAAFDETPREVVFLRSRAYQLANCKVSLLPPGLARKRVWNKKYPICITLAEGEVGEESVVEGQEEEERAEKHAILPDHQLPVTLYLFGRTGREKEEWFQHFLSASRAGARTSVSSEENTETQSSGDAVKESTEELHDLPGAMKTRTLLDYSTYMTQLIGSESWNPTPSPCHSDKGSPTTHKKIHNEERGSGGQAGAEFNAGPGAGGCSAEGQPTWVNSLVGRIFWDFLREKYWSDQVAHKIQKKLSKIKLPYFMNELTLADLDMGTCLPQVLSTSKPTLDRRGLWLEMELMYTGCLQMTLETKMNLCKLGKEGEDEAHSVPETQQMGSKPRLCILADSDEESSSAGSSDEEEVPPSEPQGPVGDKSTVAAADGHTGGSTGRKILRFVDKIAKSKYFQKATENEYIRKKIAEVSNMPLMLSVEVLELSGTLAINIPPPPTDRIWYSFQVPPRLDLHVRPMLGEREVTFTHVTEWIEKKLQCEFPGESVRESVCPCSTRIMIIFCLLFIPE
ncbi:LOW QUALITY PROTEIN: testis-expressed protein 2-like [Lates calcarifer]|uniref:LOW QUALITY PROTEIN: testis-expressed protein 2-like n=1 Tax=Lates calcarifer TaxID=8187 RepID=A0AAJ8BBU8_LATCA|nr:LOW QUALITY PROTEIN: testis-expressed protein 2-like [Lates calcarifer]